MFCFRAIINHFSPKIESYAAVNHISQLSEDQVSMLIDSEGFITNIKPIESILKVLQLESNYECMKILKVVLAAFAV